MVGISFDHHNIVPVLMCEPLVKMIMNAVHLLGWLRNDVFFGLVALPVAGTCVVKAWVLSHPPNYVFFMNEGHLLLVSADRQVSEAAYVTNMSPLLLLKSQWD